MATLSGFTIQDTYQSLLKTTDNLSFDTYTGDTAVGITDGYGNRSPLELGQSMARFRSQVDFSPTTRVNFSGATEVDMRSSNLRIDASTTTFTNASVDFTGADVKFDNATRVSFTGATDVDFANANVNFEDNTSTTGILRNAAVLKSTGRLQSIDGNISFSGGTGVNVEQDIGTNTFTFTSTGEGAEIIKIGTGETTTAYRLYYWDNGQWNSNPTSVNAYDKLIGISVGTDTLTDGVITTGLITDAGFTGYTEGALYLTPDSTLSSVPDYTEGNAQRGIGHSVGSYGIFLNPDIYYQINVGTSYITTNDDEVLITNDGFALAYE